MLHLIKRALADLKLRRLRRIYREGQVVSRFIARDVRREVLVVSVAELEEGVITARVKTTNLLYVAKGLVEKTSLGPPERIPLNRLWDWSGASWGGLPDGTSIATKLGKPADSGE
jgi:hypothetical protein